MPRKTFDMLLSSVGVVLTGVLIVAGVLGFWGYSFANSNVHDQLAAQRITMPSGPAIADPAIKPYLSKYAGQQMTNGAQAEAYADHFIAVHLKETAGGKTYAELSTLSRANPTDTTLAGQVQTVFRGETLRSMLLNAYGFWKLGQLALIGSIVSFALAGVMGILSIFGFVHFRRVNPERQILTPVTETVRATA